jgi:hypothetical protein
MTPVEDTHDRNTYNDYRQQSVGPSSSRKHENLEESQLKCPSSDKIEHRVDFIDKINK